MPTTISISLASISGEAGPFTLFLRKTSDRSLVNTGGDALTEVEVATLKTGVWTATVAETIPAEDCLARIYEGSSEAAAAILIDSVLYEGQTEIGKEAAASGGLTPVQDETLTSIATAIAGSAPVEPTGASETVMARLTRIEAATGSILGGRVLRSAGPVTPAGDISLVVGSDYVEDIDGSLLRSFSDPGASIHAKLTAGALSQLVFSAAEKPSDPSTKRIAGTITEVSEADGVTSVRIEILRTAIPVGPYSANWKYHIWREADDLVSPPLLEGCLTLEWRA